MSPNEEDGGGYEAFTLPCRRSHCLSEGLSILGIPNAPCPTFQGRRAQTTQVRLNYTSGHFPFESETSQCTALLSKDPFRNACL